MNIYKKLDEIWKLLPIRWTITLLAKMTIGLSALYYYEISVGHIPLLINISVNCWMFMQIYDMARHMIFSNRCQNSQTLLWNKLEDSIRRLDKATTKRIQATKLRIWVQNNLEINIFNYWLYKIIRRSEWINIDCDAKTRTDDD
jgi:hypothetical protein